MSGENRRGQALGNRHRLRVCAKNYAARQDLIADSNQLGIAAIAAPEKMTVELLADGARQSPECFPMDLCAFVSLPVFK
jgi:hypothetical protein